MSWANATESILLDKVMIHRVGNPSRGETLSITKMPVTLNDALVKGMLTRYFIQGFQPHELYQFAHPTNLELNEVYQLAQSIFGNHALLAPHSERIARHLYSKSTHVQVKEGELYVALLHEVPFANQFITALGIFKSETKDNFLKVFPHGQQFELAAEEGIHLKKPDKGCLILNTEADSGYRICVIDPANKQHDTKYWVDDFLQLQPVANEYHHTREFLQLCHQFATEEMPGKFEMNKSDQIALMQRSLDYFKTNEHFAYEDFAQEVIHHPEVVEQFARFKDEYAQAKQIYWDENGWDIDATAVKKQSRVYKSVLKLDKNFHIYIHGRRDLIERGYDEQKGKYFYKVYFEEEQ